MWLALTEPFWAGSDLGQPGSGTLHCSALVKPRCGPLTASTRCGAKAQPPPSPGRGRSIRAQTAPLGVSALLTFQPHQGHKPPCAHLVSLTQPPVTACNASFGPTASAGSSLVVPRGAPQWGSLTRSYPKGAEPTLLFFGLLGGGFICATVVLLPLAGLLHVSWGFPSVSG